MKLQNNIYNIVSLESTYLMKLTALLSLQDSISVSRDKTTGTASMCKERQNACFIKWQYFSRFMGK